MASRWLACLAQAISSETGKVIDDFVLKKAANYKPNLAARNAFLDSGFQSTYQPSFLEARPYFWPLHLALSSRSGHTPILRQGLAALLAQLT